MGRTIGYKRRSGERGTHMAPRSTELDTRDGALAYPKLSCENSLHLDPLLRANIGHLLLGEPVPSVLGANLRSVSPSLLPVAHIVTMRSYLKMRRIHAPPVVALVPNKQAIRYRAMYPSVGLTVGPVGDPLAELVTGVSEGVDMSLPVPAERRVYNFDLTPKSVRAVNISHVRPISQAWP